MGLIKAQSSPPVVKFQWRDTEADAKQLVADAQREAETIVQKAQSSADALREAARIEGFGRGHAEGLSQGRDEGRQTAIEEYSQQIELTIAAMNEAIGQAVVAKENVTADAVTEMVELAIAIAERVTKRQAMIDPQVLIANLGEALSLVGRQKQIRLAIHPSQRQVLAAALPQLQMEWPALGAAQIIEDPSLAPGGCRLFTEHGQIDADLEAQLDRVVAGLMPPRSQEAA